MTKGTNAAMGISLLSLSATSVILGTIVVIISVYPLSLSMSLPMIWKHEENEGKKSENTGKGIRIEIVFHAHKIRKESTSKRKCHVVRL